MRCQEDRKIYDYFGLLFGIILIALLFIAVFIRGEGDAAEKRGVWINVSERFNYGPEMEEEDIIGVGGYSSESVFQEDNMVVTEDN